MATESDRKRSHLERIIEQISEESSSIRNGSFLSTLVPIPEQAQEISLLGNRDSSVSLENADETKSVSGSTSDEETGNEKEDSTDADESAIPMKISPRCDVCGLLHFKSYRCLTKFSAPSYLRKAFDDNNDKLRVCRKCLTSKDGCLENVAISSLASYSAHIRQMKIPLGITSNRRTKAFEFVVRDLKQLKNGRRTSENSDAYLVDSHFIKTLPLESTCQPMRKTLLQRFNVDDPIEKNLFLKELNLYSTDFLQNMSQSDVYSMQDERELDSGGLVNNQNVSRPNSPVATTSEVSPDPKASGKVVYHVAAKNVLSTNVTEKKIGEMFDARKGMNHDLVVNTKRAWKPNKKYDDLRKVERPHLKKELKRVPKQGKSLLVKPKVDRTEKTGDQPEKVRTCGINCAVCDKHVQKSYSCCTLQTAPEKFKHLFTPGVTRLKICRKCIPYKKVVKVDNQAVVKKKTKLKQKKGRKPKPEKPRTIVKAVRLDDQRDVMKSGLNGPVEGSGTFTTKPFASVGVHSTNEMLDVPNGTIEYDRNGESMDIVTLSHQNSYFQLQHSIKKENIPVGVATASRASTLEKVY